MVFSVSEEVTSKEGGPRMIVTGYASGMVECGTTALALNGKHSVKMNWWCLASEDSSVRMPEHLARP